LIYLGGVLAYVVDWKVGLFVALMGGYNLLTLRVPAGAERWMRLFNSGLLALGVALVLTRSWQPLGVEKGLVHNFIFVALFIGGIIMAFRLFQRFYPRILGWCLDHKALFLTLPLFMMLMGAMIWQGYDTLFGWLPRLFKDALPAAYLARKFPGIGKEFMPPLDEGAYLYMPVTMPHASIGEVLDILQRQDRAIEAIPEVESVVGKLGRVESPLDPAPISMIKTLINCTAEYRVDGNGRPARFRFKPDELDFFRDARGRPLPAPDGKPYPVQGKFDRDADNHLIPDDRGSPFRLWRPALDPELNPGRRA